MNRFQNLFDATIPSARTSATGVTNARFCQLTDVSRHVYRQIFAIFDHLGLEYYVFAGALVGYVRNGHLPPWADDIDVMVLEDQCDFFERDVVPYLRECGFQVAPPKGFDGGGYHILSMRLSPRSGRDATVPVADGLLMPVPWAQVDVFFSRIDAQGLVRNRSRFGWGLYHAKDIPVEWVVPGVMIDVDGYRVRAFSDFESDVMKEYGDVRNNLVIHTHDSVFLRIESTPWQELEVEFEELYVHAPSRSLAGLCQRPLTHYEPSADRVLAPRANQPLARIIDEAIDTRSATIVLAGAEQIVWSMDIKRLLPRARVVASAEDRHALAIAGHLRHFIDEVLTPGGKMTEALHLQESMLRAGGRFAENSSHLRDL